MDSAGNVAHPAEVAKWRRNGEAEKVPFWFEIQPVRWKTDQISKNVANKPSANLRTWTEA